MDLAHALAGFLVGLLVGVTGVGGGSLMAPLLILIFGVAPATAVGSDLLFAAITKSVGGAIHHAKHSAEMRVVLRLGLGSIPAAILTIFVLHALHWSHAKQGWLPTALGLVLVATAMATVLRPLIHRFILRHGVRESILAWQLPLTIASGAILGVLVTITSIGAGALGATLLVLIYPLRLSTKQIVGTDIVHAIPLTLVAGFGHWLIGSVDLMLVANLLIGSIPGIIVGSLLIHKVSDKLVRISLSVVLVLTGVRLIAV